MFQKSRNIFYASYKFYVQGYILEFKVEKIEIVIIQNVNKVTPMVLILDGNSKIGAHVKRNLCCSTCLRHLISSTAAQIGYFYPKRHIFLHGCATCYELPSNISTMVTPLNDSTVNDKMKTNQTWTLLTKKTFFLFHKESYILNDINKKIVMQ